MLCTSSKTPHLRAALALCGLGALAGCMVSPADGTTVSNTSQTLNFSGYHPYQDAQVRVKAYNFSTRRYDTVANAVSSSTPLPPSYWDDTLYPWYAASRTLPSQYWEPGRCAGSRALVKGETVVGGRTYGMYSMDLEANAEGCTADNRNNSDWVSNCSAPQSELTTLDYTNDPRPLGLQVTAIPVPNSSCNSVSFSYSHPRDDWRDVRMSFRRGSRNYSLSCTTTSQTRTRTYGRCQTSLGGRSGVEGFITALQTNAGTLTVSAIDAECRSGLRVSRSFNVQSSRYDYNWTRYTNNHSQCRATTPPPPPSDPRVHRILCDCANVAGYAARVALDGCLDATASSPATGASLMCGYAANRLQSSSGYQTSCGFVSVGSAGATCGFAGGWDFAP